MQTGRVENPARDELTSGWDSSPAGPGVAFESPLRAMQASDLRTVLERSQVSAPVLLSGVAKAPPKPRGAAVDGQTAKLAGAGACLVLVAVSIGLIAASAAVPASPSIDPSPAPATLRGAGVIHVNVTTVLSGVLPAAFAASTSPASLEFCAGVERVSSLPQGSCTVGGARPEGGRVVTVSFLLAVPEDYHSDLAADAATSQVQQELSSAAQSGALVREVARGSSSGELDGLVTAAEVRTGLVASPTPSPAQQATGSPSPGADSASTSPSVSPSPSSSPASTSPSPSPTASATATSSATATASATTSASSSASVSASATVTPSSSASASGTASPTPTASVSPSPSSVPVIELRPGAPPVVLRPGRASLRRAVDGELLLLSAPPRRANATGPAFLSPCGRSYDGRDWEPVRPGLCRFNCTAGAAGRCRVVVPPSGLIASARVVPRPDDDALAARLLLQGSFGSTLDDIRAVAAAPGDATQQAFAWLERQMSGLVPVTSHRAYYRRRTSPRHPNAQMTGAPYGPCDAGSRWLSLTLSEEDESHYVSLANGSLYVDGHIRGRAPSGFAPPAAAGPGPWFVCSVVEADGGKVEYGDGCVYSTTNGPLAFFSNATPPADRVVLAAAAVTDVRVPATGVATLDDDAADMPGCDAAPATGPLFARDASGRWLRFDPRLRFLENLESAPMAAAGHYPRCPVVRQPFFNVAGACRPQVTACYADRYRPARFRINATVVAAFYRMTGRHVHFVTGLGVDGLAAPCSERTTRWRRRETCDDAATPGTAQLDAGTQAHLAAVIAAADDGAAVVDVGSKGSACVTAAVGVTVRVVNAATNVTECWTHSHPDEMSVRDFTYWSRRHPGNKAVRSAERPNPITKYSIYSASAAFPFPASHATSRWTSNVRHIPRVAPRLGAEIDFASLPDTARHPAMARYIGAQADGKIDDGFELCSSPYEVANDPTRPNSYVTGSVGLDDTQAQHLDQYVSGSLTVYAKQRIWTNAVLSAPDQLRQRVAWALQQLFVVSQDGTSLPHLFEAFHAYTDIFVRHAFGSFGDVLREVAFSPMMARMLSYDNSRSLDFSLQRGQEVFPDENFAREVMQLFTNGLWMLHDNGTVVTDEAGQPVPSYTTDDIFDLARVWTGFGYQPSRGNVEMGDGVFSANFLDPLRIYGSRRDVFPKRGMDGRYIGDRYPLCSELPRRAFLRRGAVYRYRGTRPAPALHDDVDPPTYAPRDDQWLDLQEGSALQRFLCARSVTTGLCEPTSEAAVVSELPCHGLECDVDTVRLVRVNLSATRAPVFYEYLRPPCVHQAFPSSAVAVTDRGMNGAVCTDPRLPAAAEACCSVTGGASGGSASSGAGRYDLETMSFGTAAARCAARGLAPCSPASTSRMYSYSVDLWTNTPCRVMAQLMPDGRVVAVHRPDDAALEASADRRVKPDTLFGFRVAWVSGTAEPPAPTESGESPHPNCTVRQGGRSLLCEAEVEDSVVFVGALPSSRKEVIDRLHIGTLDPADDPSRLLSECRSGACQSLARQGVVVFLNSTTGTLDASAVFKLTVADREYCLLNRASVVRLPGGAAFRNPVTFMSIRDPTPRDAHWEVQATLDSYVEQPSVAPFIADFLIKRMVTSNPSPGYVERVARAFRTGQATPGAALSGISTTAGYGSLTATLSVMLMDPEARSPTVEADPSHGKLREPMVKLLSLLRSLRLERPRQEEIDLAFLNQKIGMAAHGSPTVFNFYQSEYQPPGPLTDNALIAPEAQILTTPTVISWLNGAISLAELGLTDCATGFGRRPTRSRNCNRLERRLHDPEAFWAGHLAWNASDAGGNTSATIVGSLDLLLTGGRLSSHSRRVITSAVDDAITAAAGDTDAGVRRAVELFAATPEFTVSALHEPGSATLGPGDDEDGAAGGAGPSEGANSSDYKAIVYLYFSGGADSYNFFVPHSSCALASQYATIRDNIALDPDDQLATDVPAGSQPCDRFATHASLANFKQLYDDGQAAFVANVGPLVEPVTKAAFKAGTARLPPSIGAHNTQTKVTQTVHAQESAAVGVLGRIRDSLQALGVPSSAYSLQGNAFVLTGESSAAPSDIVHGSAGPTPFDRFNLAPRLQRQVEELVGNGSTSMLAHTWADGVSTGIRRSDELVESLETQGDLKQPFAAMTAPGKTYFTDQVHQAARIIAARRSLGSRRDVFFVTMGGFDTHNNAHDTLRTKLSEIDTALGSLVAELKLQGVWDGVTIVSASEFSRTITSNGVGTDHGWGGNTMLAGGALRGGQIFGRYPSDLTTDGDLNVGRGRLIPTLSWEAVWAGIAEWFGVPPEAVPSVLPNLGNFPASWALNATRLYRR